MIRVLPQDVVTAYRMTGLIPIRLAWTTTDARGGCAIDCLARARGVSTDTMRKLIGEDYESGFLAAWDAEEPEAGEILAEIRQKNDTIKRGFCDGLSCRRAVERAFTSAIVPNEASA